MPRKEFTRKTKAQRFEHSKGHCEYCGIKIIGRPEYDHWREAGDGGDASFENCRLACRECHAVKTKEYVQERRKHERVRDKANGSLKSRQPLGKGNNQKRATGKITKALPPRQSIYRSRQDDRT